MKPRHLSWENFRASIWQEGQQRSHRIGRKPIIDVFADGISGRIGLLAQLEKEAEVPPAIDRLAFISARILKQKGTVYLELATSNELLRRQFFQFATAVADRILLEKESPLSAAAAEIRSFDELLAPRSLLSIERQIGLLGELLVLERIIQSTGPSGVDAWTGPRGEPHDFRFGTDELEVKTASGTRRVHRIHGLDQLFSSPGMKLSLVSVLLEPAGKAMGTSLPSEIRSIREVLLTDMPRTERFNRNLEELGWRNSDAKHYNRLWRPRRPIAVIAVTASFPRLGRDSVLAAVGPNAARIDYVEYQVNVEGMGIEEGSRKFPVNLRSVKVSHV
jgi:hypothetical protein